MKNIFKYIVSVAVISAVTFASAITSNAQNLDVPYVDKNGVCFKKSSTLNPDGRTYTVTLESFVKGEVTITHAVKPADIVLVLDLSGSMTGPSPVSSGEFKSTSGDFSYYRLNTHNGTSPQLFYKHTDNNYYPIQCHSLKYKGYNNTGSQANRYFAYYVVNGVRWYLNRSTNGVVENPQLTYAYNSQTTCFTQIAEAISVTKVQNTLFQGTLYTETINSKLDLLKKAAQKFVEVVNYKDTHNPEDEPVPSYGHQIAIVTFGDDASVVRNFTPISTGYADFLQVIEDLNVQLRAKTSADRGMEEAKNLLTTLVGTTGHGKDETSKFVVFFTDGSPTSDGTTDYPTSDPILKLATAKGAITQAKTIKNTEGDNAIGATIFSVGMLDASEAVEAVNRFLNYTSSNFPNASSMTSGGDGNMGGEFYKDASTGDLSAIFEEIAGQAAGGAENTEVTSESAVTVDVITSSFNLPTGAGDNVSLMFAKCTGEDEDGYLTFDEANKLTPAQAAADGMVVAVDESTGDPILPSVALDPENNKVSLANYEYSANWCGYDESLATTNKYRGYKQILSFVIDVADDAVGGPATATNEPNSGIYVNDEPIAVFNQPTVVMPVSIWIKKEGLQGTDSAVFTIKRSAKTYEELKALYGDADGFFDPGMDAIEYQSFTKVVLNEKTMTDGVVKVVGLDARFIYTIKEDAWAKAGYIYQNGGTQYTMKRSKTAPEPENPFTFSNEPNPLLSTFKVGEDNSHNVFEENTAD